MKMTSKEKIYKPPKWIVLFLSGTLLFICFLIIMVSEISFASVFLFIMALMEIVAIIEISISKVMVKDSTIEIIGLFKKQIIDISEIQQSKAEGYQVFIYFKNGKIQKMPSWFGSKRGFQQVVNNKIKKLGK